MITVEKFKLLYPKSTDPEELVKALNDVLPKYGINTKPRVAAFLAQCGHESGGWRVFSENLNYSAEGLRKIFPKYFKTDAEAQAVARKPEQIANIVYANRMGNGNTASGDGWKYRGRGPIQLTGKDNYAAFSKDMFGGDRILNNPDLITTGKMILIMSAVWFWNKRGLNELADKGDILNLTKRINGGTIGLDDRKKHYEHALKVL